MLGKVMGLSYHHPPALPLGWLPYPDRSGPGSLLQTKAGSCPDQ